MKPSSTTATFLADLKAIVGAGRVLTHLNATYPCRVGFRSGGGAVLAIVQPTSLVQLLRLVRLCVRANKIIIMQAANTGLTGGSTPLQEVYDREVVVINTLVLTRLFVIELGRQVICLPGTTLN